MRGIRSITKSWWVLVIAVTAALVPAAAAQARHPQPAARAGVASREASAPALRSFVLAGTDVTHRSLVPAAAPVQGAQFQDPTGDSATAPDITSVIVVNDASGQITFNINFAMPLVAPSDFLVGLAIDSDQNTTTGESGIDYIFLADLSNKSFSLGHWNGSTFVQAPDTTASVNNLFSTVLTFSINSSDLGHTTGFNFFARSITGPGGNGDHDTAPDSGTWSYQLGSAAALALSVESSHVTKAKAGKTYQAAITVARSDGAAADVTTSDVTCAATVGRRPLHASAPTALGPVARCSWRLPKKSKGKTLRASVTVTLDGATITKTFTAKIR